MLQKEDFLKTELLVSYFGSS